MSKFFVRILEKATKKVAKELSAYSEREAERIKKGMSINLNHEDYEVVIQEASNEPTTS